MNQKIKTIKISFLPIIAISFIIVVLILIASIWDQSRTYQKLERLAAQSQQIYKAHAEDFVKIAELTDPILAGNLLNEINAPERGVYNIYVLRNTSEGMRLLIRAGKDWKEDVLLNPEQERKVKNVVDDSKTTTSTDEIFKNFWWGDNSLYAFTPIKRGDSTIGYVMVVLPKSRNID